MAIEQTKQGDGKLHETDPVHNRSFGGRWFQKGRSLFKEVASSRNSIFSLADQVVASATNFLTGIIIARVCVKEELGIYMLGFTIILFVNDLQTSLISAPYMVYSQRLSGTKHALYMGSSLIHQLGLSFLVMLTLVVGAVFISHGFGSAELGAALKALCLVVFFVMGREFVRRICFTSLEMRSAFVLDCIVAFFQLSGLLVLAYLGFLSGRTTFFCIGLACGATVLVWLVTKRESYSFQLNHVWVDFKKNLSFGKWTLGSSLLWALSMTIYPWLLAYYHGTASTGVWAACWGVIAIANPLLLGIQNFLGPKIVQSYTGDGAIGLRRFVVKVSTMYCLIIAPLAVVLFLFGGQLVVLFYGAKYSGNGLVVAILAVNLLILAAAFTMSRALLAMEHARLYFMANIVPLVVILTLGLLLVKQYGPVGVAWGLVLGNVTTAITMSAIFVSLIGSACAAEERV